MPLLGSLLKFSVFVAIAVVGEGSLQCYYCQSTKSLEDCERKQTLQRNCIANISASCYIFQSVAADGTRSYGKSCIRSSMCNKAAGCLPNSTWCEVYCCQDSLCNQKNSSPRVESMAYGVTMAVLLCALHRVWR